MDRKAAFLPDADWPLGRFLVLDITGCAIIVQGVYLGKRQVYDQLEKN
jgi:hypothetical protein